MRRTRCCTTMWFVKGSPSSAIVDESAINLVCRLVNEPCAHVTQPPLGWSQQVTDAFVSTLLRVRFVRIPNLYPFIVGGVGCGSVEQYLQLIKIGRLGTAWNEFMAAPSDALLATLYKALADVDDCDGLILPDSVLSRVLQNKPVIKRAADNIALLRSVTDDALTLPDGALTESFDAINTQAVAQRIIGRNIVSSHATLQESFNLNLLFEAVSWSKLYTGTDTSVLETKAEVLLLLKSAQRTNQEIVHCTVPENALLRWGLTEH